MGSVGSSNKKKDDNSSQKASTQSRPSSSAAHSQVDDSPQLPPVKDLESTLQDEALLAEFRKYLRTVLDGNDEPEVKLKFEVWLDYVLICRQVFELEENETKEKADLMKVLGNEYLSVTGYNVALPDKINRSRLVEHCKELSDGRTSEPDESLLRPSFEYLYDKLLEKHNLFRKYMHERSISLHAFLCRIL